MNDNDSILYFEIKYINLLKILTDTLDKSVEEIRWIFTKSIGSKDNTYIFEISSTNPKKTFFLKGKFTNDFIKNFNLTSNKIEFILKSNDFIKILKSHDKSEITLIFNINKEDTEYITVRFKKYDNSEDENQNQNFPADKSKKIKKSKNPIIQTNEKFFKLKIFYPEYSEKQIVKINYDRQIFISHEFFHKTCKDFDLLSKYIKIICKKKIISFNCDGDKCEGINNFKSNDSNIKIKKFNENNGNVSGIYLLEDIVNFNKLSDICSSFYFNIKNNYFLETIYEFENYGTVNIIFIPNKDDDNKNISWDDNFDSDNVSLLSDGVSDNKSTEKKKKKFN